MPDESQNNKREKQQEEPKKLEPQKVEDAIDSMSTETKALFFLGLAGAVVGLIEVWTDLPDMGYDTFIVGALLLMVALGNDIYEKYRAKREKNKKDTSHDKDKK